VTEVISVEMSSAVCEGIVQHTAVGVVILIVQLQMERDGGVELRDADGGQ